MRVIGIVAEYNPFHTGHQYQISESRRAVGGEAGVVAVMSGTGSSRQAVPLLISGTGPGWP